MSRISVVALDSGSVEVMLVFTTEAFDNVEEVVVETGVAAQARAAWCWAARWQYFSFSAAYCVKAGKKEKGKKGEKGEEEIGSVGPLLAVFFIPKL